MSSLQSNGREMDETGGSASGAGWQECGEEGVRLRPVARRVAAYKPENKIK